jgi:hypothetical protein
MWNPLLMSNVLAQVGEAPHHMAARGSIWPVTENEYGWLVKLTTCKRNVFFLILAVRAVVVRNSYVVTGRYN